MSECWYCGNDRSRKGPCDYCGAPVRQVVSEREAETKRSRHLVAASERYIISPAHDSSFPCVVVYRICDGGGYAWQGSTWKDGIIAPEWVRKEAYAMLREIS